MSCCKNPEWSSSTYHDKCLNCGYEFNYLTNEETLGDEEDEND